jgi:hypothetical protein
MKKLSLSLEELRVESFRTDAGEEPMRGTVRGHYGTEPTKPGQYTCEYQSTDRDMICPCCPL